MNTKIIDYRDRISNTEFFNLEVGDFFQDNIDCHVNSICMKISQETALRFHSCGEVEEEDWSTTRHTKIIPLKATITVERG